MITQQGERSIISLLRELQKEFDVLNNTIGAIAPGADTAYVFEDGTKNPLSTFVQTSLDYNPATSQEMLSDGTIHVWQNYFNQVVDSGGFFGANADDITHVVGSDVYNDGGGIYPTNIQYQVNDDTNSYREQGDWVTSSPAWNYGSESYIWADDISVGNPNNGYFLGTYGKDALGNDYYGSVSGNRGNANRSLVGTDGDGAYSALFSMNDGGGTNAVAFMSLSAINIYGAYTSIMAHTKRNTYIDRAGFDSEGAFDSQLTLGAEANVTTSLSRNAIDSAGNSYTSRFFTDFNNTGLERVGTNVRGAYSNSQNMGIDKLTTTRTSFDSAGRSLAMQVIMTDTERAGFRRTENGEEQDFGFFGTDSVFGKRTSRFYHTRAGTGVNQLETDDDKLKFVFRDGAANFERGIVFSDIDSYMERQRVGANYRLGIDDDGGYMNNGDFEINNLGSGIIIQSPDTTRWRITVDNTGAIVTAAA